MSMSPTGEITVSRRGSRGAIAVAATTVFAAAASSERGEPAVEVGGDESVRDGWDIVDTLVIERL